MLSLIALIIGFVIDLIIGDPHGWYHPVIFIGNMISFLEKKLRKMAGSQRFRKLFPDVDCTEKIAGAILWITVVFVSTAIPFAILYVCEQIHVGLRIAVESVMCWQILAVKSLRVETMKVYEPLKRHDIDGARYAVSMIVGRDTQNLDEEGITKAAVETVAENTSDGIIAPMFYMAIGGAWLGFLYKAVNTMDSMLGYVDPPYTNIGFVPAKMDDFFNYIPARISAFFMLISGLFCGMDIKNGIKIFLRDRYKHASPNSAQTESACAGLMKIRLAGDAFYRGILHKKPYIGDAIRPICIEDIPAVCRLMTVTSVIGLIVFGCIRFLIVYFVVR